MNWSPATFWASTPVELYAAIDAMSGNDDGDSARDWQQWAQEQGFTDADSR